MVDATRLGALVADGHRVTVAVDSDATVDAAAAGGVREVLIDVNVGFRCGCAPEDAGRLADRARAAGLDVRGVMAYEAHAVLVRRPGGRGPGWRRRPWTGPGQAHADVGGEVVSGGGTGTWDLNDTVTELQAGSFLVMDTAYAELDLPFRQALFVEATVISASPGAAVADAGIKSLAMDHGDPTVEGADVLYCSDEHLAFLPRRGLAARGGRAHPGAPRPLRPDHRPPRALPPGPGRRGRRRVARRPPSLVTRPNWPLICRL